MIEFLLAFLGLMSESSDIGDVQKPKPLPVPMPTPGT
jgi:hypothetical protein